MLSRRIVLAGVTLTTCPFYLCPTAGQISESQRELLAPYDYPPVEAQTQPRVFGLHQPDQGQTDKASAIIASTPTGPRPFDVAKSFVTRFTTNDPDAISQWPLPQAWNPLVVEFFSATPDRATNDTVPWCAAFMNWCLERSHRPSTNSASSQSFATTNLFEQTSSPGEGDIVVFTCYAADGTTSLGVGHVTFFERTIDANHIVCLGGNQSGNRPSTISEERFPTQPFNSRRHINGNYVEVIYRIKKYLSVA